jgi:hypothetical protein
MASVHTHYDNLKVTRNAPPEVIRAAYRSLSQKYHPDLNLGRPDAERVMKLINQAYEVLSDPAKRKEHDRWIAREESSPPPPANPQTTAASEPRRGQGFTVDERNLRSRTPEAGLSFKLGQLVGHVLRNILWYLIGIGVIYGAMSQSNKTTVPSPPYVRSPPPAFVPFSGKLDEPPNSAGTNPFNQFDERTAVPLAPAKFSSPYPVAPNGSAWPFIAGYVEGYVLAATGGLSTVTVDNAQNDSAVFVKLVSIDGPTLYPVRQFYIPAHDTFTLLEVRQGTYDVRYRDLSSGGLSKSEPFTLEEIGTETGTRYSNLTMTLYKVRNGNMKTFPIAEGEF